MKILLLLLFCPIAALAQSKPTYFETKMTWSQIKQKAKQEKKYIFVDCFTTWCGPCKYMDQNVFPDVKTSAFLNRSFINVRVQFDKTINDSQETKKWYADADDFKAEFAISKFPTFLIFSTDGEMLQKIVGSSDVDEFIKSVTEALNPETQYASLFKKYTAGNRTPEFLKEITHAAAVGDDVDLIDKFASEYLATQSNLYTKDNLEFIETYTASSRSKGFDILLKSPDKADAIMGEGKSRQIICDIITKEQILPLQSKKGLVDFAALKDDLKAKYPNLDFSKNVDQAEINYHELHQDWIKFYTAIIRFQVIYSKEITADELNDFSWGIFEGCTNPTYVAKAINWSYKSVVMTQGKNATFLDTYANLLYKNGQVKKAMIIERKACSLVTSREKSEYLSRLSKMKQGKKTW